MQHGHVAWACSKDMQQEDVARTCSIDLGMEHRHSAGNAARTCSMEIQLYVTAVCTLCPGQSYNQTFTSFPAWKLVFVPVGTRAGNLRIHVSFSNQGSPKKGSKLTWHNEKSWTFTSIFLPWDQRFSPWGLGQGTHGPCFSLQLRRPTKKF
jgi:hypothetical protein